jgi:two-component system NtrC family response regulator
LAQTFLQQFAEESGKKTLSFAKEAIRAIIRHPWPGNVRELKNRVQRAVIMAEGKRIGGDDLELKMEEEQTKVTLKVAREKLEREMVQKALRSHAGTITAAAAELGISRPTFYELMDRLDIPRGS